MLNQEVFTALLSKNCKALCPFLASFIATDLDQAASDFIQAINKAFNRSTKHILRQNISYL